MPKPLSDLERRVLDYLVEYLRQNTYQPSIREIGRRFEIKSTKTVSELLQSLADKGWIERDPSRSRGVRLLGLAMNPETVTVPWYDRPADGSPREVRDRVLDAFELDRKLAGSTGTFIVAMVDDSMAGDGIRKGDLLLVEPVSGDAIDSGDVVLARTHGAQLVKRLHRRGQEFVLESSNPDFPPQVVRAAAVELLGRVVSMVRRLRVPPHAAGAEADSPPARGSV